MKKASVAEGRKTVTDPHTNWQIIQRAYDLRPVAEITSNGHVEAIAFNPKQETVIVDNEIPKVVGIMESVRFYLRRLMQGAEWSASPATLQQWAKVAFQRVSSAVVIEFSNHALLNKARALAGARGITLDTLVERLVDAEHSRTFGGMIHDGQCVLQGDFGRKTYETFAKIATAKGSTVEAEISEAFRHYTKHVKTSARAVRERERNGSVLSA